MVTTRPEMFAQLIIKGRNRITELNRIEPEIIVIPVQENYLQWSLQNNLHLQIALSGFTGKLQIHHPSSRMLTFVGQHSLELKPKLSPAPIQGPTVFTDSIGRTGKAALTWLEQGQWKSKVSIVQASPQIVELKAVVMVFELWHDNPVNIVTVVRTHVDTSQMGESSTGRRLDCAFCTVMIILVPRITTGMKLHQLHRSLLRQNTRVTLDNQMGQDSLCLSVSTPDNPFHTCLIGIPTFHPTQFTGWVKDETILTINETQIINICNRTWRGLCGKWTTIRHQYPNLPEAIQAALIIEKLNVTMLPPQELDLLGSMPNNQSCVMFRGTELMRIAMIYSVDKDEKSLSSLEIIVPRDLADGFVNNKRESYKFNVLAGYNGTIFAYGQTGSGKTFTITGGAECYSDRGIIPRTLSYIFDQLQKDSSKVYTTHVSYLEIYNECGYDLLDSRHEASRLEDLTKVTIMEDPDQNIHLKNLSLQQATNEEEALNLLFLGDTNRMIAETPMNQASTRSHCIFTIHISSKEPGSATIRHSKLHLVDLAGSERVAKTGVGGHLLTEAKYINLSLHYLEQVIIALAEKNRSHIPYRNSMMTSVLRDSLGGNCMTTMIATLSIDKRNIDESISTCRFAQRVALIKNEAVLNEEIDPRLMIVQLKKEIQELKDELALVTGKQRTSELSQEELLQLDELIEAFLEDNEPDSILDVGADMRKIKYCFIHLKQLMNHSKISDKKLLSQNTSNKKDSNKEAGEEELKKLKELLQQRDNEINILVNMLKKEKKKAQDALFHLNAASAGSTVLEQSHSVNLEERKSPSSSFSLKEAKDFSSSVHKLTLLSRKTGGKMSLGYQEAFEVFKRDHADSITIEDNNQLLKQRFAEAKCLGEKLNEVRNKINHLKGKITQRRIQRAALAVSSPSEELNTFDPVEEKLRTQIEEEKKSYKTMFNRLKELKVEIEHLQLLMEKVMVKLQKDFEIWWSEEAINLQQEKPLMVSSTNTMTVYPQFIKSVQHLSTNSFSETTRVIPNEDSAGKNNSTTSSNPSLKTRTPPSSSIPLTGDSQADADILAFIKARQNILQKKGLGNK
ncbi:kinesin-like protein KIF6 [Athene cunicularia]|uniref:kinesin-like protein KIF6 n=1 Tax=Athene cunicularia TaxID=194338 RepID=UPI000EF71106|nr:kinesin-like protein KIF6 [Athene cunicularia]